MKRPRSAGIAIALTVASFAAGAAGQSASADPAPGGSVAVSAGPPDGSVVVRGTDGSVSITLEGLSPAAEAVTGVPRGTVDMGEIASGGPRGRHGDHGGRPERRRRGGRGPRER